MAPQQRPCFLPRAARPGIPLVLESTYTEARSRCIQEALRGDTTALRPASAPMPPQHPGRQWREDMRQRDTRPPPARATAATDGFPGRTQAGKATASSVLGARRASSGRAMARREREPRDSTARGQRALPAALHQDIRSPHTHRPPSGNTWRHFWLSFWEVGAQDGPTQSSWLSVRLNLAQPLRLNFPKEKSFLILRELSVRHN